ncbi:MAG TPA: carboxymuconolactone decarboxylase family protein [Candidatus Binatia bacterium]|jgi:4-carboxymuconolactone decarboxylase
MARVPLIEETKHPELAASIAKIKGARGGRLINIYRLMLHSPALANAWFDLNQAVRYGTEIDGQSRELAVIRVAILNGVEYVQRAHGPAYALQEGLTPEQVAALSDWRASQLFNAQQRALLAYTDAMTENIEVTDDVFDNARQHFSERQIVELTLLIGAYNMLTRFLQALKVDPEPPTT